MRGAVALVALAASLAPVAEQIQISARARLLRPGEVVVLALAPPLATDTMRVVAFDREVAAYKDGDSWRAIVATP